MKKILKSAALLLCGVFMMAACTDDNDSNPRVNTDAAPSSFMLNVPTFTDAIDLAKSTGLELTWRQPNYGFPAAAKYKVQVSLTNTYNTTLDDAAADETGATIADHVTLADIFTGNKGSLNAASLIDALMRLSNPQWTETTIPAEVTVFARMLATLDGVAGQSVSNVISFKAIPAYKELADAMPATWYITGACIADGGWNNSTGGLGTSVLPLFVKKDYDYDKVSGKGEFEFTFYYPSGGEFKVCEGIGDWDHGFCSAGGEWLRGYDGSDDKGNITLGDGAGYYRITVKSDLARPTFTAVKLDITPTSYAGVYLTGSFNGWSNANPMSAVETFAGAQNHLWQTTVTLNAGDEVKFYDGNNWQTLDRGGVNFPYGTGTPGGSNIVVNKDATYVVIFNDITDQYMFMEK